MLASQNGYSANDVTRTVVWTIPGTTRQVRLRAGAEGYLLTDFASWFDANIEDIDEGQLDDWGYAERTIRGDSVTLSNHASGTAIDLNATRHPLGTFGTYSSGQELRIREVLETRYGGTIRSGIFYEGRKDPMHFEINASPARCAAVAAKLRAGKAVTSAAVRVLPYVDLSNTRQQARLGGTKALPGVKRIQRALNHRLHLQLVADGHFGPATRSAYKRWQNTLGYHGANADGVPGNDSLKLLGAKRFRVVK